MVNQAIWIGIAVGVFFAGLGIGFTILQSTPTTPSMMTSQQMQQMMNDPQAMQQMHDMMMNNPQHMNQMMGPMMDTMMNDPQMQQQMMTHMMGHQGMMNYMMNNQDMMNMMMGEHMMGQGMMGQGMMMGPSMMHGSSSSASQSLPTGESAQTRTFEIFLDEIKLFAETENENGEEEVVEVELHLWNPSNIVVNKGDTVVLKVSNPRSGVHSLAIPQFGVSTGHLEPRGGTETIQFVADQAGVFTFICNTPYVPEKNWCSADHAAMTGTITVLE